MAFDTTQLEEVRGRTDIVEVIGAHVRLRRAGRNWIGLCPFHQEKTPSFSVNAERGFFYCFGCGAGGTVFNFVMRTDGLTFPETVRSLASRYGVALRERDSHGGPSTAERDSLIRANQVAAEFYAHVLWNTEDGSAARDYLQKRGVSQESASRFTIGFAPARPAALAKALDKRGLLDGAIKTGLVKKDSSGPHDMFRARLMFPIRDTQGRTIAFGGRVLDDRLPKYINSPESPLYSKARSLYGLYEARQAIAHADRAIVVEGYLDAIAVSQAGLGEVVASLGTALTVEQLKMLARFTRNVFACFDGDDAGRRASLRALEVFIEAGLLGRGVFIPAGFDPDTLIRDRGAAAFSQLLDSVELLIDYFVQMQAREAAASIDGRARAAGRVAEVLAKIANPFEVDLLARKAAGLLGVREELLRDQARRAKAHGRRTSARSERPAAAPQAPSAAAEAEIGLLAIAMAFPGLRAEIVKGASAAQFDDRVAGELLAEVCGSDSPGSELEVRAATLLSEAQQSRLSKIMVRSIPENIAKARELIGDYLAALDRRRLSRDVETHRCIAAAAGNQVQAAAAAQELIALRRRPHRSDEAPAAERGSGLKSPSQS